MKIIGTTFIFLGAACMVYLSLLVVYTAITMRHPRMDNDGTQEWKVSHVITDHREVISNKRPKMIVTDDLYGTWVGPGIIDIQLQFKDCEFPLWAGVRWFIPYDKQCVFSRRPDRPLK